MNTFKRGSWYWLDVTIEGQRFRESLKTRDHRKAPSLARERIKQLEAEPLSRSIATKSFASLDISKAIDRYIDERGAQVSPRMIAYWREQARPMSRSQALKGLRLKDIAAVSISLYQRERIDEGRAPKTINGEVSVLRQLLTHAKLWYRIRESYKPVPNTKPPVGRALTEVERQVLLEVSRSKPEWVYASAAFVLGFYSGFRACEIKGLKWKDIDWNDKTISITRSKTAGGWRTPSLNHVSYETLRELQSKAALLNAADPDHFVFPRHRKDKTIDPTKPMSTWRSAWRAMLKEAGLAGLRFHDGRHTVVSMLAEKGIADWVIQAQVGHVDPQMMKTYSSIRRGALKAAAAVLDARTTS